MMRGSRLSVRPRLPGCCLCPRSLPRTQVHAWELETRWADGERIHNSRSHANPAPRFAGAKRDKINSPLRSGLVLLSVLVCLVIVCGVVTAALRVSILAVSQTRVDERASQAEWLAEAGLEWSRAKHKADASWAGETWRIPAATLGQPHDGDVVATVVDEGGAKVLRVIARYPASAATVTDSSSSLNIKTVTARLERPLP
jgi:Tfp pilus assembly protein PilV